MLDHPMPDDAGPGAAGPDGAGRQLGIAFVGLGGAVASTAVAGIELLRLGQTDRSGLPLAEIEAAAPGLIPYEQLQVSGWDVHDDDLASAVRTHGVLSARQADLVADRLQAITPWPAAGDITFCRNVTGTSVMRGNTKRAQAEAVAADLRRFKAERRLDDVVVMNLASTERQPDLTQPAYRSAAAFEEALDVNDPAVGPASIYAYAAIREGFAFGNFTPSIASEAPALIEMAQAAGVPLAGRDGKTGQTFLKTVMAPALRSRALRVNGWYSTNILGNRDGQALQDPDSLASKLGTKGDVLGSMLGYEVKNHIVSINYYPPRGDDKEAWDNIDVTGFLGHPMQIKVNFLCRDSVLAAPLVIEIARCLDLAKRRGEAGPVEALGLFFKAPMTANGGEPEHAFFEQERRFKLWLTGDGSDGKQPARRDESRERAVRPADEMIPAK